MNRELIKNTFREYVKDYNAEDPKIALKIAHTFRVANISEKIAKTIGLNDDDIDVSWAIGMLHDIGRFEQIRRYNTFNDSKSVNHASFGVSLLFDEGLIERFEIDEDILGFIRLAIFNHNVYRLPADLSEKELTFCKIIRDADKIDILRVNYETPMEDVYNLTTEELRNSKISDSVFEAFFEESAINHSLKKSGVDMLIGHISLVFELEYDISREILKEQGFLKKLMDFESYNEETIERLNVIRNHMSKFV